MPPKKKARREVSFSSDVQVEVIGGGGGGASDGDLRATVEADVSTQVADYDARARPYREYADRAAEARERFGKDAATTPEDRTARKRAADLDEEEEGEGDGEAGEAASSGDRLFDAIKAEKREKRRQKSEVVETITGVVGEDRGFSEADADYTGTTRLEAFNLQDDRDDGYFTADGNFVWKKDSKDRADNWLEGAGVVDKKIVDRLKRESAAADAVEEEKIDQVAVMREMVELLQDGETPTQALQRYGGRKSASSGPKRRSNVVRSSGGRRKLDSAAIPAMGARQLRAALDARGVRYVGIVEIDELRRLLASAVKGEVAATNESGAPMSEAASTVDLAKLDRVTELADLLLRDGVVDAYSMSKAAFSSEVRAAQLEAEAAKREAAAKEMWEYKMTAYDTNIQGPHSKSQMADWLAQGYFVGEYVVYARQVGSGAGSDRQAKDDDMLGDLDSSDDEATASDAKAPQSSERPEELPGGWRRSDLIDWSL